MIDVDLDLTMVRDIPVAVENLAREEGHLMKEEDLLKEEDHHVAVENLVEHIVNQDLKDLRH